MASATVTASNQAQSPSTTETRTTCSERQPVRGAFIVLEGLDRSGKTTQAELLRDRLRREGYVVEGARFPDRTTPTGQIINTYLTSSTSTSEPLPDQAIHLLFTANRWEAAPRLTALLNTQQTTVVSDRYYYSGMVYSAAKRNPLLSLSWARQPEVGLPRPDLVVFLDLEGEEARRRGGWGEERYERAEMQERVREVFSGLAGKKDRGGEKAERREGEYEGMTEEREDLVVVDAGGSVESVAEEVWRVVEKRIREVHGGEVGREVRRVS